MPRADLVVAIRNGEQRLRTVNAAAQVLEQVERCFVRPMHVFKDDQRLRPLQLIEGCGEDYVAIRSGVDGRQQRALRLPRDVEQRGEGLGREECIACPPQYSRLTLLRREFLKQCGLANPRFAAHEGDTTSTLRYTSEPLSQIGKISFTLEQFHQTHTRVGRVDGASCN